MKTSILTAAAMMAALAVPAAAQQVLYDFDGGFEDATFAVENAIIGKGLVIDYTSHVGEMLNRTGEDVGSGTKLFDNADIFLFCSAVVSRQVMEADLMNISNCPYGIFVYEKDGAVKIGYRDFPNASMDPVEDLLSEIVDEAGGTQ